jgi:alkylation response protein AidB-like acyl-CoA dehydrogenase
VDFDFSAADEEFRAQLSAWLSEHLTGRFAPLAGKGGSQNDEMYAERIAWERELHAGGWSGLGWPAAYGGRPATITQRILFELEYARAKAPYRVGFQGTNLLGPTLIAHGTEAQKKRFLPPILRGDEVWCQGFSEPGAGSDLASLRTRAEYDDGDWVINGQKVWTSHAHQADWMYLLARSDAAAARHRGITMFLLPMDQPGVEVRTIRNMAGGDDFNEVFLTDARTTGDPVVGEVNRGWPIAMETLEYERGTAMLGYQTQFEREWESVAELARRTGALEHETIRHRLVDSRVTLQIMHFNNLRTLTSLMQRGKLGPETSLAKIMWPQWHQELGQLEMDLMGESGQLVGPGYELTPFQRSFLLSRAESIYGGSHQIHLNIAAERLLGLPRDPRALTGGYDL